MSTAAVEVVQPQHCNLILQRTDLSSTRMLPTTTDLPSSVSPMGEVPMEDLITTADPQSDSKETKKKGFNLKKTAKNVVSGITRRKKSNEEKRPKSHETLSIDAGDQASPNKMKIFPFSNPNNKLNKMWASLNKTLSGSTAESQSPQLQVCESRSTMTLGRFFGKKKYQEMSEIKEEGKAKTLGRMFNFNMSSSRTKPRHSDEVSVDEETKENI